MISIYSRSLGRLAGRNVTLALLLAAVLPANAQNVNFSILSLNGNGVLTWTNHPQATSYCVQWAPTATGPWFDSWDSLARVPATGTLYSVAVPMFYRVAAALPTHTLLIHGDSPNGSTTFIDQAAHTITGYGDTQVSTNRSRFGGASIRFDGSGDYLICPTSADWALGTNDFTVDLWVNFVAAPGTVHLLGLHTSGISTDWSLVYEGGAIRFFINGAPNLSATWAPALDAWYHLAATRGAGILRLFVDGALKASGPNTSNITGERPLTIGAADNPALFLNGYLDEIRIHKGVAWWTTDFTPPTVPYD